MSHNNVFIYNAKIWNSAGEDYSWMVVDIESGTVKLIGHGELPDIDHSTVQG